MELNSSASYSQICYVGSQAQDDVDTSGGATWHGIIQDHHDVEAGA